MRSVSDLIKRQTYASERADSFRTAALQGYHIKTDLMTVAVETHSCNGNHFVNLFVSYGRLKGIVHPKKENSLIIY